MTNNIENSHIKAEEPLVTVGISSFNYSQYIDDALNSVLSQTYKNIEIIIIDDCSSDDCPQKIDTWIKTNNITCTYIKHEKNIGITRTTNEILSLAKGKYICFFATDDIMLPDKILLQVQALEKAGDDYGVCYANVETMDEDGTPLGLFVPNNFIAYTGDVLRPYVFGQLKFATPGCLLRTSLHLLAGVYDENVLYEDYNFWLRAFASTKAAYSDYPCLIYRQKATSPIKEAWRVNNKERYFKDRIISNQQALNYIKDEEVKGYLKRKIVQYLKSLYNHKSPFFKEMRMFLINKGYNKTIASLTLKSIFRK